MIQKAHTYLSLLLLFGAAVWGPAGCGTSQSSNVAPATVRENPSSYTPLYSPRYTTTSRSGGGWSSGK